jgi:hypothetical protein
MAYEEPHVAFLLNWTEYSISEFSYGNFAYPMAYPEYFHTNGAIDSG